MRGAAVVQPDVRALCGCRKRTAYRSSQRQQAQEADFNASCLETCLRLEQRLFRPVDRCRCGNHMSRLLVCRDFNKTGLGVGGTAHDAAPARKSIVGADSVVTTLHAH